MSSKTVSHSMRISSTAPGSSMQSSYCNVIRDSDERIREEVEKAGAGAAVSSKSEKQAKKERRRKDTQKLHLGCRAVEQLL